MRGAAGNPSTIKLVRCGFPQTEQMDGITQAQRLLRKDIIDKVLERDMTALFGVSRVLDLEHTLPYLCMHDGVVDMADVCSNLEVKRPTARRIIELVQAARLTHRLPRCGHGKDLLPAHEGGGVVKWRPTKSLMPDSSALHIGQCPRPPVSIFAVM